MTKRSFTVVLGFALAAVLVSGGLVASNMGFKLNYPLLGPGDTVPGQEQDGGATTSVDGTNRVSLPYNRQSGIDTAKALLNDLAADGVNAQSVALSLRSTNGLCTYTGVKGTPCTTNFSLDAGLAYDVKVGAGGNYIVVGSHDPALSLTFLGPGSTVPTQEQDGSTTSVDGTNTYAHPYHGTATTAKELLNQIGSAQSVALSLRSTNGLCTYTGVKGTPCTTNFTLTPGTGISVKVGADVPFSPPHF